MSAGKLIESASSKGYGIGRNQSSVYRYNYTLNGKNVDGLFNGTWREFVKFVIALEPVSKIELNEKVFFRYCRWSVKQKDWTKGMIVWRSDTQQIEDSETALEQAISTMVKSGFQVQGRLKEN